VKYNINEGMCPDMGNTSEKRKETTITLIFPALSETTKKILLQPRPGILFKPDFHQDCRGYIRIWKNDKHPSLQNPFHCLE